MAAHFVTLARGVDGGKYSDFTVATSANSDLFQFSIQDGVTPKKAEILKALLAFERFFENAQQVGASGFDVAG